MALSDKTRVRITYKNSHYLVPVEFILRVHPGGSKLILPYVNQDITRAFVEAGHSNEAVQLLEQWMEGVVAADGAGAARGGSDVADGDGGLMSARWRAPFAAWTESEVVHAPSSALWDALVYGIAGATTMAAVLCRQLKTAQGY
ncbi:hypothetical protein ABB37_05997 [Leptomonas pyrrhocoris]|uniref:Cytochrome b5 heme-binding domain-containing protein n=1 Tax=Leptomonas pyrrhocoris TaxID=157538 RepID=A0A0M9FZ41_LEPPY|nr:hypothetical protein ABB37_05997 [Leptomonas pyrrhocoris]KPA78933.1 hypothetical protein ABB37_05997 [Leptomonas pyrrhocoris]|eukprot:XP_015657372.1 hypothetical protein ABB37_05997 [Leptomonas pyrrhocoris]